ncbi:hypothetical protein Tco_1440098, partial [Tanacetum coccineum]
LIAVNGLDGTERGYQGRLAPQSLYSVAYRILGVLQIQLLIRRPMGVVIGIEVPKKSAKGALRKLEGIEILSEAALYESDMKKAVKANK